MNMVATSYHQGTWRLCSPEDTLANITPHLHRCGITRCADVTQLDNIGIPVYCAIRPTAAVLQVSNGKGLTHASAKVSALMEGIEFFHCENPDASLLQVHSTRTLQ
jgi:YcaO-like protein with predicted kinase domain